MIKNKLRNIALASMLFSATGTAAAEWDMLPFLDDGFEFNFTLSGTAGSLSDSEAQATTTTEVYGVQLSFECPWFSSPDGNLRTHFNHNSYAVGTDTVKTFEINPHWFNTDEGDGISYGPGVGAGYIWSETSGSDMFSANLLFDVEYRSGLLFVGVGLRYMATQDKPVGTAAGMDNTLIQAKVGLNLY